MHESPCEELLDVRDRIVSLEKMVGDMGHTFQMSSQKYDQVIATFEALILRHDRIIVGTESTPGMQRKLDRTEDAVHANRTDLNAIGTKVNRVIGWMVGGMMTVITAMIIYVLKGQ